MKRHPDIVRRHRRIIFTACVALWIGALIATHTPAGRLPRMRVSDRFLHAVGYFALGGMFWLTLRAYDVRGRRRWTIVLAAMAAYAAVDEITQPIVGRNASTGDWAADVLGASIALCLCEWLVRRLERTSRRRAPPAP